MVFTSLCRSGSKPADLMCKNGTASQATSGVSDQVYRTFLEAHHQQESSRQALHDLLAEKLQLRGSGRPSAQHQNEVLLRLAAPLPFCAYVRLWPVACVQACGARHFYLLQLEAACWHGHGLCLGLSSRFFTGPSRSYAVDLPSAAQQCSSCHDPYASRLSGQCT